MDKQDIKTAINQYAAHIKYPNIGKPAIDSIVVKIIPNTKHSGTKW